MNILTKEQTLTAENKALKEKNRSLEDDLLRSRAKDEVGYEIAQKVQAQAQDLFKRNQWLENRNKELENPEGDYHSLGWMGKIVFTLRKMGRPLRKKEIMKELTIMDTRKQQFSKLADASGQLSVTLKKGIDAKRLFLFDIAGTRGGYYALPEWVDEMGKLEEEFMDELY